MLTPSLLAHSKRVLSDWNAPAYDHDGQKRAADPRDPHPPGPFDPRKDTNDGEAW
jgi:hypothetical protein